MSDRKKVKISILICIVLCLLTACTKTHEQIIIVESETLEVVLQTETIQDKSLKENSSVAVIFVEVCGMVRNPGVYQLEMGARIFQAIEAAGGYLEGAAVGYVNQAAEVEDGQQVRVPAKDEVEVWNLQANLVSSAIEEEKEQLININTADESQLMTLPGIGQAKAKSIIEYRNTNGKFNSIEELKNIEGIKDGVYNKLKDKISV